MTLPTILFGVVCPTVIVFGCLFPNLSTRMIERFPQCTTPGKQFVLMFCLLVVILGILFAPAIPFDRTLFSNDGPLGSVVSDKARMPDGLVGVWNDLEWVGRADVSARPDLSAALLLVCEHPVIALTLLGLWTRFLILLWKRK